MNQVDCAQCGGANPRGSKYCNLCGAELPPATSAYCPRCQHANPLHLMYCDSCGARLHKAPVSPPAVERPASPGSTPLRTFDLPLRSSRQDAQPEPPDASDSAALTDWLRREGLAQPGDRADAVDEPEDMDWPTPGDGEASPLADFADWLEEQQPQAPEPADKPEPDESRPPMGDEPEDVMASFDPATLLDSPAVEGRNGAPDPDDPAGFTLDWLSDVNGDSLPEPEPTTPPEWLNGIEATAPAGNDNDGPDWLADLADLPAQDASAWAPLADFDQLADPGEEAPDDARAVQLAAGDFPEWLRDAAGTQEEASAEEPPDWLDDVPVWDASIADTPVDASADAPANAPANDEDELDWLTELGLGQGASESAEPVGPVAGAAVEAPPPTEPDEPDVEALPAEAAEEAPPPPVPAAESEFARWLEDAAEPGDTERTEPAQEPLGEAEDAWELSWETADARPALAEALDDAAGDWPEFEEPPGESRLAEGSASTADDGDDAVDPSGTLASADVAWDALAAETGDLAGDPLAPAEGVDPPRLPTWLLVDDEPEDVPDAMPEARSDDEPAISLPDAADTGTAVPEAATSEALPDWLAAMPSSEVELPATPDGDASGWPDWALEDEAAGAPGAYADIPDDLVSGELPDWLAGSQPDAAGQAGPGPGLPGILDGRSSPVADPLLDEALPDWLRPDDAEAFDAALDAALAARRAGPTGEAPGSEWSDLLGDQASDGLPEGLNLPSAREFAQMGDRRAPALEAADIPDWLTPYKPRELRQPGETEIPEEPPEESGPLAGLRGVLGIEPVVATPRTDVRGSQAFTVTPEEREQVLWLRQLASMEAATLASGSEERERVARSARWILALLLLAAVLLGALLPGALPGLAGAPGVAAPEAARAALDAVQATAGQPVLVAFGYTPSFRAELEPQARMLLSQLAQNGSPVLAVSGSAAGVAMAEDAISGTAGLEWASLGWLPGEASGLRALGACLSQRTPCATVAGKPLDLGQFGAGPALLLVITGDRGRLVGWIEQVGSATEIPIVAATTQALAPAGTTYYSSGALAGVLAGTPAAAAYERLWLGEGDRVTAIDQAGLPARWLAILLLLVGNGLYLARGMGGRLRRRSRPVDVAPDVATEA